MDLGSIYRFIEDDRRIIRNVSNFYKAEKVRGKSMALNQSSVRAAFQRNSNKES